MYQNWLIPLILLICNSLNIKKELEKNCERPPLTTCFASKLFKFEQLEKPLILLKTTHQTMNSNQFCNPSFPTFASSC